MNAVELLRGNDLDGALANLSDEVRADPSNVKLRTFLFQLLCVMGNWDRAKTQLDVAGGVDASAAVMRSVYSAALAGEEERQRVFAGEITPTVFGEPKAWIARIYDALRLDRRGEHATASGLRGQALEEAPASAGIIDGEAFAWIADADSSLGPLLEVIINGRYFWLPFLRLRSAAIEPPSDLRDHVWMPAKFTFTNDGEAVGFVPTRYFGSETSSDPLLRLARKTEWTDIAEGTAIGSGQRMLVTDRADYPIMNVRHIRFEQAPNG